MARNRHDEACWPASYDLWPTEKIFQFSSHMGPACAEVLQSKTSMPLWHVLWYQAGPPTVVTRVTECFIDHVAGHIQRSSPRASCRWVQVVPWCTRVV